MVLTSTDELNGAPTGYTLSEAAHPWKVFRDAGHVVDFASPQGGTPPIDPNSETDEITEQYQQDATVHLLFGHQWRAPMTLIVLAAFALGMVVGVLGMLPGWWTRRSARRQATDPDSGQLPLDDTLIPPPPHGI